jgi:hypothetical protein
MASATPLQMPRLVTRYAKDMAVGDGVLIWKAGDQAGIYAIAQIIEPPKIIVSPPDIGYWIDPICVGVKPCAKIRFTSKLLEKPLLREHLKQDPVLKNLMVIRQPNATNYKITQQEWQHVHELKG